MTEIITLTLILLLATSGYAAGRLHSQFSYRLGYRYGYRQGYFDGDRASWSRRRRELQAAISSVLATSPAKRAEAYPSARPVGTTYATVLTEPDDGEPDDGEPDDGEPGDGEPDDGEPAGGRHSRADWALVDARGES